MRLFSRLVLVLLGLAPSAVAQVPGSEAPAKEPAPAAAERAALPEPGPAPAEPAPVASPEPVSPTPESAPAPEKSPESAPTASDASTPAEPIGRPSEVAPQKAAPLPASAPWIRAHAPLTLDGRLGFLVRPESSAGFDEESHVGAELGLSLYMDLKRELAVGVEIERASLGHGSAVSGPSTVSVDYTTTSAVLGVRAYPKRSELFDLFVGLQLGLGIQGVSAAGTRSSGGLAPATAYKCSGADSPALQIGGGVGARLMLSPRWGLTGRVNGTGRAFGSDQVDACAQGLGTATTISASLGVGYDFDLDP